MPISLKDALKGTDMNFKTSKALHSALQEVLGSLTLRERQVLAHRMGSILTLKETAELTPHVNDAAQTVDKERLRQIQNKALRKCRHPSRADLLQSFIPEITCAVLCTPPLGLIESLIRINSDLLLLQGIFGTGPISDDLKTELKARLVAVLQALENK